MSGRTWKPEETQILKMTILDGLKENKQEKKLLIDAARRMGRTFVATELYWSRLKIADPELAKAVKEINEKRETGEEVETAEMDTERDFINIVVSSRRITTVDAAIKHFKINMSEWEVERYKVKTSEGYRKDRRVQWEVMDGKVTHGKVDDSGKMLVVPMFHIQVTLKRKTSEIRTRAALDDMIADAVRKLPKPQKRKYARLPSALWYEVDLPDIHFGKEVIAEESGHAYNIEIARKIVLSTIDRLLDYARPYNVEQILLPMGNDFFNSDTKENTTTHGTPQQEDTDWRVTFRAGRRLAEDMINKCLEIAPVKIVMVPGNHDEQRAFYLGEALTARYHSDRHVNIEVVNTIKKRKYIHFGKNLIGFTHGYWEKPARLPSLMPLEEPEKWAASIHREFHLGDKHHKKDLLHRTEDIDGVTVRILRSLSGTDTWHFDKAYVGAPRSAEGFLWDKQDGIVAQFQSFLHKESK